MLSILYLWIELEIPDCISIWNSICLHTNLIEVLITMLHGTEQY